MQLEWWHWIVGGLVLVLAELAMTTFYIVWFGMGAMLVGLALWVVPGMSPTLQIGLWVVASVAMVVAWFRVFKHGLDRTMAGTADGDVVGEVGLLVSAVAPFSKGKVRFQRPLLGADEWVCLADEAIAAGERVRVVSVEGSFFKVVKH
ncbi:MAG: NfeD family protein [Burkholderiales bacterium]|nr:NfeD family protein [Burkholderiales bacterium]